MTPNGRDASPYYRFFKESEAAMAITDEKGYIIKFNRAFNTLFKTLSIGHFDFKNSPVQDVLAFSEHSQFPSIISQLIEGIVKEISFITSFRSSNDVVHWLKIRAWLIEKYKAAETEEGPFIGLVLEDQTKERKEEEQLQADREIAQRAMEDKSRFLANMSHEIRTPIQTIIGMTELLQDTKLDREQAEYARQVKFSAEVLLYLINDILDYSKIEAGKMVLEKTDFDLEQTIEQAVEMISMEAHKKGLELILDLPQDINIMIVGDPYKFRQIVINLVKNAVKFTKQGSVTISAVKTTFKDGEAVMVSVADTGIGIAKDLQDQLFTTFFQGDPSNTRRFGGTGLGLSISKNLVELMNGKIEMRSNEGGGSVFSFIIPVERSRISIIEPLAITRKDDCVLVVDDHPAANRIISTYLYDLGYKNTRQAGSGEEALKIMREYAAAGTPFSFCLIDMVMPQMDGWRLAAEIKNDETINSSKLILMVPHGLLGADAKMTLLKWFYGYINKPIERHSLKDVIDLINDDSITELEPVENESAEPGSYQELVADFEAEEDHKPLVMIVEDHHVNQKLFSMIMEKIGYPTVLADDGQDAVEKADPEQLALIFMDIQMPRMNGYEAVQKLREMGFKIPIVAVTASALSGERERCMEVGFNDILVKPFKIPDIEKVLYRWIGIGTKTLRENQGKNTGSSSRDNKGEHMPEPHTQPENNTVFDIKDVLDTFMGDREVVKSLIEKFIERSSEQIAAIRENINQKDFETGRRNAHTIKGSSLTLSARELGGAAAELERAFKEENPSKIEASYLPVEEAFERLKKELASSGI